LAGAAAVAYEARGQTMSRSLLCLPWYLRVGAAWLAILAVSPAVHAQEASVPGPPIPIAAPEETTEDDAVPAMFAHPETDRWWISGQANWISQWHPAFHSPYEGPRSLSPQAQDATSRVLTLFTGVRFTNTNELLCDVQETGGHGIGEAVGLAGGTNLRSVRQCGGHARIRVCDDARVSRATLGGTLCGSLDAESGQRHSPRCGHEPSPRRKCGIRTARHDASTSSRNYPLPEFHQSRQHGQLPRSGRRFSLRSDSQTRYHRASTPYHDQVWIWLEF